MAIGFEIERKFLIDAFPEQLGEPLEVSEMKQGYISTSPTVRIRSKKVGDKTGYKLCFKSSGTLERREVEIDITEEKFNELIPLLNTPLVFKLQKVYSLENYGYNLKLECNFVSSDDKNEFYYAEVEFDSVKEAESFTAPEFLKTELTDYPNLTMSSYCKDADAFIKALSKII